MCYILQQVHPSLSLTSPSLLTEVGHLFFSCNCSLPPQTPPFITFEPKLSTGIWKAKVLQCSECRSWLRIYLRQSPCPFSQPPCSGKDHASKGGDASQSHPERGGNGYKVTLLSIHLFGWIKKKKGFIQLRPPNTGANMSRNSSGKVHSSRVCY